MNPATIDELQERIAWHQATVHHMSERAAAHLASANNCQTIANKAQAVVDDLCACVYYLEDSPQ